MYLKNHQEHFLYISRECKQENPKWRLLIHAKLHKIVAYRLLVNLNIFIFFLARKKTKTTLSLDKVVFVVVWYM